MIVQWASNIQNESKGNYCLEFITVTTFLKHCIN